MKLVHVVPHIGQETVTPSYFVPRLCQRLAASGHTVELTCSAARSTIDGVALDLYLPWPVLGLFAIFSSLTGALRRKTRVPVHPRQPVSRVLFFTRVPPLCVSLGA